MCVSMANIIDGYSGDGDAAVKAQGQLFTMEWWHEINTLVCVKTKDLLMGTTRVAPIAIVIVCTITVNTSIWK